MKGKSILESGLDPPVWDASALKSLAMKAARKLQEHLGNIDGDYDRGIVSIEGSTAARLVLAGLDPRKWIDRSIEITIRYPEGMHQMQLETLKLQSEVGLTAYLKERGLTGTHVNLHIIKNKEKRDNE